MIVSDSKFMTCHLLAHLRSHKNINWFEVSSFPKIFLGNIAILNYLNQCMAVLCELAVCQGLHPYSIFFQAQASFFNFSNKERVYVTACNLQEKRAESFSTFVSIYILHNVPTFLEACLYILPLLVMYQNFLYLPPPPFLMKISAKFFKCLLPCQI